MNDQSEPTLSLEVLPVEVLMQILYELPMKDQLVMRLVSKKFVQKVSQIAMKELAYDFYCLNRNWFSIDKPVQNRIVIPFASRMNPKYCLIRSSVIFRSPVFNLTGLRLLRISYGLMPNRLSSLVEYINKFVQLEQLEFRDKHTYGSHLTLRLPNLKVLYVYNIVDGRLNVDAPKLTVLYCETQLNRINLSQPTSVCELHLNQFDAELAAYRDVQLLTVQQAHIFPASLNYGLMNRLHRLNEIRIRFQPSYGDSNYCDRLSNFEQIRETLAMLLTERSHVKAQTAIIFEGIRIDSHQQVKELNKNSFV